MVADVTVDADVTVVDGKMLSLASVNSNKIKQNFVVLYKVCYKPFNLNIALVFSGQAIFS